MSRVSEPQDVPATEERGDLRTTRRDWLDLALQILVEEGAPAVKVLTLAQRLGGSRSSFYWFFESREALLDALLDLWRERNTRHLLERAERPAPSVSKAVLNVFECWADPALFDARLDFAVREWARRSPKVLAAVKDADEARLHALGRMFARHGCAEPEALVRARTLYCMQIGYYALGVQETDAGRAALIEPYVEVFSGERPDPQDVEDFLRRFQNP